MITSEQPDPQEKKPNEILNFKSSKKTKVCFFKDVLLLLSVFFFQIWSVGSLGPVLNKGLMLKSQSN